MTTLSVPVTRQMLVRYAGASGDFNPIHFSDFHARELGQESVIAHGMLTMGLAMRLVTEHTQDPAKVKSCKFRFKRPVPVPDDADGTTLELSLEPSDPDADGLVTWTLTARVGEETVGTGQATVIA